MLIPFGSALVGGGLTMLAGCIAHRRTLQRDEQAERAAVDAFLAAINAELDSTWRHYMDAVGHALENHGQGAFRTYYIAEHDYFTTRTCSAESATLCYDVTSSKPTRRSSG